MEQNSRRKKRCKNVVNHEEKEAKLDMYVSRSFTPPATLMAFSQSLLTCFYIKGSKQIIDRKQWGNQLPSLALGRPYTTLYANWVATETSLKKSGTFNRSACKLHSILFANYAHVTGTNALLKLQKRKVKYRSTTESKTYWTAIFSRLTEVVA